MGVRGVSSVCCGCGNGQGAGWDAVLPAWTGASFRSSLDRVPASVQKVLKVTLTMSTTYDFSDMMF